MYRATLIFSYSFSLSGYYTYFGIPSPCLSCARAFSILLASIPFLPLRRVFSALLASIPFFPLRLGYFLSFWPPCARVFSALFGLYTLFPLLRYFLAAPWVFPALSDFSYPRNTEILCMLFSYNTQDSIGKRFPQPFL